MDKSLGTLLRFWGVFQFTQVQPLPSPHKQCWTRVSRVFFPSFNFVQCGGRENCKKILKRMHCFKRKPRNDRKKLKIAVLSQGLFSRIVGMTIKKSNEDGQTHFVKRRLIERWFSRIVGLLGRSYVKVALKLKVIC